jgi:hypothetical protein
LRGSGVAVTMSRHGAELGHFVRLSASVFLVPRRSGTRNRSTIELIRPITAVASAAVYKASSESAGQSDGWRWCVQELDFGPTDGMCALSPMRSSIVSELLLMHEVSEQGSITLLTRLPTAKSAVYSHPQ